MGSVLVAIWEAIVGVWGVLVEMLPWLGRIMPWLSALLAKMPKWFQAIVAWFTMDTAAELLRGGVAIAVRVAAVTAWGVFLAVVFSGIFGLAIRDIAFTNPFSGFPAAMMFLVAAAFPIKFGLSLVTSYVAWRFTVNQAAIIMIRTVKYLFGV